MVIVILGKSERMRAALQAVLESRIQAQAICSADVAQTAAWMLAGRQPALVVVDCWSTSGHALAETLQQVSMQWPEAHSLVLAETALDCRVARTLGADETLLHDPSAVQLFAAIDRLMPAGQPAAKENRAAPGWV